MGNLLQNDHYIIVPKPRKISFSQGFLDLVELEYISIPHKDKHNLFFTAKRVQQIIKDYKEIGLPIVFNIHCSVDNNIVFEKNFDLPLEGYLLEIKNNGITINYNECAGAFHAISTLKQIVQQSEGILPFLKIEDYPDFKARGIMLDISRNKIPEMETLYKTVDLMADLKLNQLQLYIEGFPFAYPSFPYVWKGQTPVTGEEIILLDRYCTERFIELVPNQNSFGHMMPWLERAEFNDMAECPGGFEAPWGWSDKPLCLNPLDPKCIEFLATMYDDLLPYFSSDMFNVGCDEIFELGQGKSKELCESIGKGRVFFDFLMKIYKLVKKRGKKMMIWGDIILHYSELIQELPKDVIALEWGYLEDQPYLEHCKKFMDSGIPFYVCPGTYSCNSITGFTDRTRKNLQNAARRGRECGAIGYLITDWGDGGHWQPLPVSYAGFSYGAALSWGVEQNEGIDIAAYLNRFIFMDKRNRMGNFVLDLGNYYLKELKTEYDGSGIFRTLQVSQLNDKCKALDFLHLPDLREEDFTAVKEYVGRLAYELDKSDMECKDVDIITAEFRMAIRLILHGAELGIYKLKKHSEDQKIELHKLLEDLTYIIKDYKEVWVKRNRTGGLENSIKKMKELEEQYIEALQS